MFPEDLVHNIVKSNHEALPCDLRDPFPRDEGLHTEFARKIDGTVEDAVPEDLVHSILKSKGEALPCDWMEPILRDGGLHRRHGAEQGAGEHGSQLRDVLW
jgi:hypothetical protein